MVKYVAQIVTVLSMLAVSGDQILKAGYLTETQSVWVMLCTNIASALLPGLKSFMEKINK